MTAPYTWQFSYPPYDIQKDFMSAMNTTLNDGKIGIFESPTGTGKSLSIISSALHWLKLNRGKPVGREIPEKEIKTNVDEPDWVTSYKQKITNEECEAVMKLHEERLKRVEKYKQSEHSNKKYNTKCQSIKNNKRIRASNESDDEFAPDNSEDEFGNEYYVDCESSDEEDLNTLPQIRKIFFCSRTHSQLSQFMNEVRKTPFNKDIACVALGSRIQLCVNPVVRRLQSNNAINEHCLDLADAAKTNKKTSKSGEDGRTKINQSVCPYYDKGSISKLKDYILSESQDIETVAALGSQQRSCSYYASRVSVQEAELVALPYSMLLHKETRDSLGISLEGNIVIFDEAHNLIEAINAVHSCAITLGNLVQAHMEVSEYKSKYQTRLGPKNSIGINSLNIFIRGLMNYMKTLTLSRDMIVITTGDLVLNAKIDHINLFDIINYVDDSRLTKKLRGFAKKHIAQNQSVGITKEDQSNASALQNILNFMRKMTNMAFDGKVLISSTGKTVEMKFLNLNPGKYFEDIVASAHSIVLAGGTMQPTNDVTSQLFGSVPESRLCFFSCGHVIPKENMICLSLARGPTNQLLEFNYENRSKNSVMDEAGRTLINICNVVPHGVVVFLPSYGYADQIYHRWKSTGLIGSLNKKKKVFREERGSTNVETILAEYGSACKQGALLLSVVGGKLSEGINFKDDLARSVVMIGLPFPNANDPELRAKLEYLKSKSIKSDDYIENQCMKAVNQCIGRAIRHRGDYASIVLLDVRYGSSDSINSKLSKWVTHSSERCDSFPQFYKHLRSFYNTIKKEV